MRILGKVLAWSAAFIVFVIVAFVAWSNYRIAVTEMRPYDEGAPGRYVTFEGHRLHVLTKGAVTDDPTGAPVLLLHGFINSGHESFLTFKDRLAEGRGVIAPDLLSYGNSERVTEPGDYYTLPHSAAGIAAILDALGVAQVDVVGHSYGGVIAAQFALDYPQRVRRIVFMDAAIYVPRSPIESIVEMGFGVGRALTWNLTAGPVSLLNMYCSSRPACAWTPYTQIADTTDAMMAAMWTNRHTPFLADLPARVGDIGAPALVLNGDDDFIVPPTDAERLAASLPDARLTLIHQGGHMPYVRHMDEVLNAVAGFLQPST